jgi:hypothetical protein
VSFAAAANPGESRIATWTIAGLPFLVAQGGSDSADLTPSLKSVSQKCSDGAPCRIKASVRVRNDGASKAKKVLVRLLSSDDALPDAGDPILDEWNVTIGPGASKLKKVRVDLAPGTSASGRRVIAVVDPAAVLLESDRGNNTAVSDPIP